MGFEPIYPVLQTGASVPSWLIDIKRRGLDLHQSRFYPATCVPNRCRPYPDRHPPKLRNHFADRNGAQSHGASIGVFDFDRVTKLLVRFVFVLRLHKPEVFCVFFKAALRINGHTQSESAQVNHQKSLQAPRVGLEPTPYPVTADRTAIIRPRNTTAESIGIEPNPFTGEPLSRRSGVHTPFTLHFSFHLQPWPFH